MSGILETAMKPPGKGKLETIYPATMAFAGLRADTSQRPAGKRCSVWHVGL